MNGARSRILLTPAMLRSHPPFRAAVAIPVHDEVVHIGACLQALSAQTATVSGRYGVLLLLNDCTDGTPARVAELVPSLACPVRVVTDDVVGGGSAGWARRRAMDEAALWLEAEGAEDGVILTSDGDSVVGPDWVACNLAVIDAGADAVAGRLALDPIDAALLPAVLHARGALEAAYEARVVELYARLDPSPHDPWPRHATASGATLAVRLSTYRAIGGLPEIPSGEDKALVRAVLAHDLRVRHDPGIVVVTSGRLVGRARDGVADTMRLRCAEPDRVCDDLLEPLPRVVRRALLRRCARTLHGGEATPRARLTASMLGLVASDVERLARLPFAGAAAAEADDLLPSLPLRPSELPAQIARADRLLRLLRRLPGARRAGTSPSGVGSGPAQPRPTPV